MGHRVLALDRMGPKLQFHGGGGACQVIHVGCKDGEKEGTLFCFWYALSNPQY